MSMGTRSSSPSIGIIGACLASALPHDEQIAEFLRLTVPGMSLKKPRSARSGVYQSLHAGTSGSAPLPPESPRRFTPYNATGPERAAADKLLTSSFFAVDRGGSVMKNDALHTNSMLREVWNENPSRASSR